MSSYLWLAFETNVIKGGPVDLQTNSVKCFYVVLCAILVLSDEKCCFNAMFFFLFLPLVLTQLFLLFFYCWFRICRLLLLSDELFVVIRRVKNNNHKIVMIVNRNPVPKPFTDYGIGRDITYWSYAKNVQRSFKVSCHKL